MPQESQSRTVVTKLVDDNVGAGATKVDVIGPDPLPSGKRVRLMFFGASEVGAGDGKASVVGLQWGSAGAWKTIRVVGLVSSGFQCAIEETFTGDGTKKFRLARQNNSSAAKKIIGWVTGYQL